MSKINNNSFKLEENKKIPLHLSLSPWDLTDDYNRHAGVTLLSALDHCSIPVVVHLLYDAKLSYGKEKEEAYNKECYQKIVERYGAKLQYHHVELPDWVNDLPTRSKWPPGALMRLYLPDLLYDVDRVIYLDCDMVVNLDISELWNLPIDDYYLAACPDSMSPEFERKRVESYISNNIPLQSYFCSGTLVMNLEKLRMVNPKFSNQTFTYLKNNLNLRFPDQDMLNWFCRGEYYRLEEKMNIYTIRKDVAQYSENCILHYATKENKPWIKYNGDIDDYYWEYLADTPWCESKSDLIRYLRMAPDIDRCLNIFSNNFLSVILGDKLVKLKTTLRLTHDIWKSVGQGVKRLILKPLVTLGIIYKDE